MAGLGAWSFLMATAHGAGLMLVPALMPLCLVGRFRRHDAGGAIAADRGGGSRGAHGGDAVRHAPRRARRLRLVRLAFLRRGWINVDRIWMGALIVTGLILIVSAVACPSGDAKSLPFRRKGRQRCGKHLFSETHPMARALVLERQHEARPARHRPAVRRRAGRGEDQDPHRRRLRHPTCITTRMARSARSWSTSRWCSATRPPARSSRSGQASRSLKPGDRVCMEPGIPDPQFARLPLGLTMSTRR